MSEERDTKKVYAALFAVQKDLYAKDGYIAKSANNAVHKNKYIPLPKLLRKLVPMLHSHGCMLVQKNQPSIEEGGANVLSVIVHVESGQFITSNCTTPPMKQVGYEHTADGKKVQIQKITPQSLGGAVTYARRYDLESLFAIPTEDDDGNAASGASQSKTSQKPVAKTAFQLLVDWAKLPDKIVKEELLKHNIKTVKELENFTMDAAKAVINKYKENNIE